MADIRFYHMERSSLEQVLPQLLNKALSGGHKIILQSPQGQVERLNTHLWSYDVKSFLPHGSVKDGHASEQPIWLSADNENPNGANVLILTHGMSRDDVSEFSMVCEMLDGRDAEAVSAARGRWKLYKDAGHEVTYWQQDPNGKWEKKA